MISDVSSDTLSSCFERSLTKRSRKTTTPNDTLWSERFLCVEPDGEGPRSKFEQEDGQTDGEEYGTCERLWRCGATSQSCKVTRAIRNVSDQPKPVRTRPAVENVLRPVEFKTIPQPRILDAWSTMTQYRPRGHHPRFFGCFRPSIWPCSCSNFDLGLSQLNSSKKKAYKLRDYDFGVQFFL